MPRSLKSKPIFYGIAAAIAMSLLYVAVLFITMRSMREVWQNFKPVWYLIVLIVIGFGVQVGLWVLLKTKGMSHGAALPSVSGAGSGVSMVACCAHHAVDVLPILGLSGAALFLSTYQKPLLVTSVSINILGIAYMMNVYAKLKYNKT